MIVLPVLVAAAVDESAVALTQRAYRLKLGGFATLAQPVVVDLTAGRVHTFRGTRIWGYAQLSGARAPRWSIVLTSGGRPYRPRN